MKKIGFIDYYWMNGMRTNTRTGFEPLPANDGGRFCLRHEGCRTRVEQRAWCEKHGMALRHTVEEVVAESDYLIVLSPDNPEHHEALAQLPLASGSRRTSTRPLPGSGDGVAPVRARGRYGTPMYSSSALRFATEYREAKRSGIETICSWGPGMFENYSIHQIEPIVSLMGTEAKRIMFIGTGIAPALLIEFKDGRQATMHHLGGDCPFTTAVAYDSGTAES